MKRSAWQIRLSMCILLVALAAVLFAWWKDHEQPRPTAELPEEIGLKQQSSGHVMAPNPVCAVWLTFVLLAEPIEEAHLKRTVEASKAIEVGMTPQDVRELLGEPDAEYGERGFLAWLLMGYRPRQWMYGTFFNLDYLILPNLPFPNPFPINIRIAEYAEQDLVIDWSREDVVTAIRRPAFEVPPFADDMLDAVNYVKDLYRLLSASPD